jgi:hypothetical protein
MMLLRLPHPLRVYFTKLLIILDFAWISVRFFRIGKSMGRWWRELLGGLALDPALAVRHYYDSSEGDDLVAAVGFGVRTKHIAGAGGTTFTESS